MFKKIAIILAVTCMLSSFPIFADSNESKNASNKSVNSKNQYNYQLATTEALLYGGEYISSKNAKLGSYTDANGIVVEKAVIIDKGNAELTYQFNIPETAVYCFALTYIATSSKNESLNFDFYLDGKKQFDENSKIEIPFMWKDAEELNNLSEYAPEQIASDSFRTAKLIDSLGAEPRAYRFELTSGIHTVTLSNINTSAIISKLGFVVPDGEKTYQEISEEYKEKGYKEISGEPITIQGESAYLKTSRSLVAKSDNSSAALTPSHHVKPYLNYIGGSNWSAPNSEITWRFTVKESGLYKISAFYKQDQNINTYSYRTLKIDNEIPFAECEHIRFYYGIGWQFESIGEDEDYLFYLEKGEHTISLTSTLGETAIHFKKLRDVTSKLGDMYIDITMITGESPDANRDYELFKQIPDFNESLSQMSDELEEIAGGMLALAEEQTSTFISSIRNMTRVLNSMVENPYSAQNYVKDYYTNYTTVSSWLYDMKSMPLSIDSIQICPADSQFEDPTVGFFGDLWFGIKRFVAAFTEDYSMTDSKHNDAKLKIWVNWGRDQAMVLNNLINESFTRETGIVVNLEITNATLIKGILSNNAPDLSLHLARTEPVNLAMRGALVDLSEFKDYSEVIKRFGESSSIPYQYKDGVYALPDTQAFYIMFYRKDILDSLGIKVPETWDEFLAATAVLQRNNMNAWIPYTQITTASTVNLGVGGLNMYASILQQFGGNFYNEEKNECNLNSDIALESFSFWTDMYTKYKLPTTTSFYNRFRIGTVPLGIETYTTYTTLADAAPEIEGRWGIALVPGIKKEDGTVDHTVAGSGTGCAIIKTSENKEEAWEFLKWWTRADTQLEYNNNVESILGTIARVTTANLEAFENMSWNEGDIEILLKQRSYIEEIPEVPGSYFVSRSVDQAFWNVTDKGERAKDMLDKWGTIASNEIKRKIKEYEG